jgi:hypothetical protein
MICTSHMFHTVIQKPRRIHGITVDWSKQVNVDVWHPAKVNETLRPSSLACIERVNQFLRRQRRVSGTVKTV